MEDGQGCARSEPASSESDNTAQLAGEKSGEESEEATWYLSSDFRRDPKWLMDILADR